MRIWKTTPSIADPLRGQIPIILADVLNELSAQGETVFGLAANGDVISWHDEPAPIEQSDDILTTARAIFEAADQIEKDSQR